MRKYSLRVVVAVCLFVTIYSCEKTNDSNPKPPKVDTVFTPFPDTVATQFIVYSLGNTTHAAMRPQDTIDARFLSNLNQTTVEFYSNNIAGANTVGTFSITFLGTATAGIKTVSSVEIREQPSLLLVKQGEMKATIFQFDNFKSGYIIGSISGTIKDSIGPKTYPFRCSFKVQRDF